MEQDPDYGTFNVNGHIRVAESPRQRVSFIFEGHREITDDAPPPRAGRGSGRDVWAAYAAKRDVDVPADASREDIIAALEAAGVDVGTDDSQ